MRESETQVQRHLSPLRYPGGKASLAPFLTKVVLLNDLEGCEYFEPYAGGAGAALAMLIMGHVRRINLNDADFRIYCFWRGIVHQTGEFIEKINNATLTIDEWKRQKQIVDNPRSFSRLDVGFATFFMNRCNRSGVISGAGPIGGYEQKGNYKLSVRFNRETLADRVETIARKKDAISISNCDAIDFLKTKLPLGADRENVLVYLDPPYVQKGQRLYLNSYGDSDHRKLGIYLKNQKRLPWVMSYDDCDLVRNIYGKLSVSRLRLNYALQEKRIAKELLIAPLKMELPSTAKIHGRNTRLVDV
jgi:DNA adenine methylase